MFVEDIKTDFYDLLLGNRVLLLVNYDVDAICACKILQGLFKCDNIAYTLVPVGGVSELKKAYEENNEELKYVVLINCGGTIDLVDILQPEEHVVFFVLDSHKPTDVCNVYSDGQVRLLHKDSDEDIPNFDDIFQDEDEEEEAEESSRESLEAAAEKRRQRREWEQKRHTLLFNYTQFSYYGMASALVSLRASAALSRAAAALWPAAVAAAANMARRDQPSCILDSEALLRHIAVATGTSTDNEENSRVSYTRDLCLPLYRVWSVEQSMKHCTTLAAALALHSRKGDRRVKALLVDLGIPLQEARQHYRSMSISAKQSLLSLLEPESVPALPPLPVLASAGFLLHTAHAAAVAANDIVFGMMALLEHDILPKAEAFQLALSLLDLNPDPKIRDESFKMAKTKLEIVREHVTSVLTGKELRLAGPFAYFILHKGASPLGPHWLGLTARWVSLASGGNRPILASTNVHNGVDSGTTDVEYCWLLGLPPHPDQEHRNLFGAAFEQAASKSGVSVSLDYFDSSVIMLPVSQRTQFLDALTALLS